MMGISPRKRIHNGIIPIEVVISYKCRINGVTWINIISPRLGGFVFGKSSGHGITG